MSVTSIGETKITQKQQQQKQQQQQQQQQQQLSIITVACTSLQQNNNLKVDCDATLNIPITHPPPPLHNLIIFN
jgi:hypothetical protein